MGMFSKDLANNLDREKAFASLQMITSFQGTEDDIEQTQFRIVKGIREIFEAEDALIFLFDEENQGLVIKKQLGTDNEWKQQVSQKISPGLIADSIKNGQSIAVLDVSSHRNFNRAFDSVPEIETASFLCSPLISNGINFGALALINPMPKMLTEAQIDLFKLLVTALANAIYNSRLFMQFRVSSADLEAIRWELLNSRNVLRALFDNLPTSIYIIDSNYSIIAINLSRANRQHEKPNQLVGKKCYEKLFQRFSPCSGCRVLETFNNGLNTSRLDREKVGSGEYVEWEINTFPIFNGAVQPVQAIITEYDVTEKRFLEANLIQSEKLAAIGQLAAGMAHEIYNPLTAIIANSQMIRRTLPKVNEDLYEALDLIEHAGVRASGVIRSLLNSVQKEELENLPINLNQTIENALSLLSHEVNKRPVTIQKDLQTDLPPITANQDHLQSVWINLIMNSLDAIDQKGSVIRITSRYANSEFVVTFDDDGKGIPHSKLSKIFEPYFSIKAQGYGAGLGLSACLRVVKQHGGTIKAESVIDKGSKFTVTLPSKTSFGEQGSKKYN